LQVGRKRRCPALQLKWSNSMLAVGHSSFQLHNASDVIILSLRIIQTTSDFLALPKAFAHHHPGKFITIDILGLIKWIWSSTVRAWSAKRVMFMQQLAYRIFLRSFLRSLSSIALRIPAAYNFTRD